MKIHEYNEMMAYLLRPEPRQMLQRGTNPESLKALEKINLAGAARVNEKVELFKTTSSTITPSIIAESKRGFITDSTCS